MRFSAGYILASCLALSQQSEIEISYRASSKIYNHVPAEFELILVAAFTRHGDRAQITRVLSPLHPEMSNITSFWKSKLPVEKSFRIMAGSASPTILQNTSKSDLMVNLYSGLDYTHSPYAQLTEVGALQLLAVGHELRRRYVGSLLPQNVEEASDLMFCRSSNICRTVQSLRSLLAGMYTEHFEADEMHGTAELPLKKQRKLPFIFTRQKSTETLFPHADGPCVHMTERRIKLYHHFLNSTNVLRWGTLEKRMLSFIGSAHRRIGWLTWLNILDVYTCFHAHNIPFPAGMSKDDLESVTELVGWTWDVLYADSTLSRLAIGRFIKEAVDDMDTALNLTAHSMSNLPLQMQKEQSSHSLPLSMDATLAPSSSKAEDSGVSAASADVSQFDENIEDNMNLSHISTHSGGTGRQATSTKHTNRDSVGSTEGLKGGRRHVSPGARMLIYSGHDSTMVPLLKAIGLYRGDWPPYASYLTLEVARLNTLNESLVQSGVVGNLYVRAVYNDEDRIMEGCGDQLWCPYYSFRTQILKTGVSHSEYQKGCRNTR